MLRSYDPCMQDVDRENTEGADENEPAGRFSLHSLSAAFARLTGTGSSEEATSDVTEAFDQLQPSQGMGGGLGEILSPRMIVEAMLFVGNQEGRPLSNREIAATMRDVSPKEVDTLVNQLNEFYDEVDSAYQIVSVGRGYSMQLRPQHESSS